MILESLTYNAIRVLCCAVLAVAGTMRVTAAETNSSSVNSTNAPASKDEAKASEVAVTNAPPRLDYASFKLITDRNIFNPNRSRRSARGGDGERTRQPKIDSFTLVGTMSYSKGDVAFFDGSSSSYRKAAKTKESIGGYEITEISANAVKLEVKGKSVELKVGAKMRREDEGEWQSVSSTIAKSSDNVSKKNGESTESDSSEDSDVLKRLLQRREEEDK